MNRLLVVCGPTATGKTSLALKLAEKFNGELLSADSRQIYRGLDIGTGKDIPAGFKFQESEIKLKSMKVGYYSDKLLRIWGLDLVDPEQDFSIDHFRRVAEPVIADILSRGKLPILVGGTGLYIKAAVDGIETSSIPRDLSLRSSLSGKTATELYEILATADPAKAANLNRSDKANPRRLVRAIEIASAKTGLRVPDKPAYNTLFIGLKLDKDKIRSLIEKRVELRIKQGIVGEIERMLLGGQTWKSPGMNNLGYIHFISYFSGSQTLEEVKKVWSQAEVKYAKRQMTWFKREKRIAWVNAKQNSTYKTVERLVQKWYSSNRNSS